MIFPSSIGARRDGLAARRSRVFSTAPVAWPAATLTGIENVFGRRKPRAIETRERRGDILRRALGKQGPRQHQIVGSRLLGEHRILQHAFMIELADLIRLRSYAPDGVSAGQVQQQFRTPSSCGRHQQDANALPARTAGATRAMLHDLSIIRQIRMNDEVEARQIDAARGHVGRHADAGSSIPQRLQSLGSLVLRQFARERDHGKATLKQRRLQMPDGIPRVAKHKCARRLEKTQDIDDRVLDVTGSDPDGAVLDIGMTAFVAGDLDPKRLLLILLCQRNDATRKGRREQQRAARVRRGLEDKFHILAKTEIEHLISLVENDGLQFRDVEMAAPQVIAQSAGRPDHDVSADGKLALFAARIHAADAGDDAPIRILIEPCELAMDLQGELTGWRDDQGKRCGSPFEALQAAEQILCNGEPVSDGLARAGLGRNEKVAVNSFVCEHGDLNRGRPVVVALGESASQRRTCGRE
jgi:hypothetical protein